VEQFEKLTTKKMKTILLLCLLALGLGQTSQTFGQTPDGPPGIAVQPQDKTVARTYNVTFNVQATNLTPLAYQWRKGGTNLVGATNASYSINNVQPSHAGTYSVMLTNSLGVRTSMDAVLTVIAPYTFTTLAGKTQTFGTNDGLGSAAQFNSPRGVAVDANGNLFVADHNNHTIRKVSPEGMVTTLAGVAGVPGTNDGVGNAARFRNPRRATADKSGNVYVVDSGNHTIRKIAPSGMVTTIAGIPGKAGNVDGLGAVAEFNLPSDVAVYNGTNVFVAGGENQTVRLLSPVGTNWRVTTFAGVPNGLGTNDGAANQARFRFPIGIDVDSSGNVYVADSVAHTVRKIYLVGSNWFVSTLAGRPDQAGSVDGVGTSAMFHTPIGLTVDGASNVFIGDVDNSTVRKITPAGVVTTIAGFAGAVGTNEGTGSFVRFNNTRSVAVDGLGNLYVSDTLNTGGPGNNTIRKGWLADAAPRISVSSPSVSGGQVQVPFLIQSGTATNFALLQASSCTGPWSTNTSVALTTNVPGVSYRFTAATNPPMQFFRVQSR
jgi:sugar lactone lactonase YvrE